MRLDTRCATALQWVTSDLKTFSQSDKLAIPQDETTVSFGGQQFNQVPTGIHHSAIFAGKAGLIGNGLLSRFKTVTIDARAGQLILSQPRSGN